MAACASSRPEQALDPELSQFAASGRSAFARGDFKLAARFYRMARQRARVIDDPGEIGTVTYNLAAAYLELGETGRAEEMLKEARREFSRGTGVPADLILLQGRAALLQGRIGEARELAEEGLAVGEKNLEPETRVQFKLLQGRTAFAAGDIETARAAVDELREPIRKIDNDILQADYLSLEGELLFLRGDFLAAGRLFDREAGLLQKAARYRPMTRARARSGSAYLAAGDGCRAGERFYRAGRSLAARGEPVAALEMIRSALEAAEDCPEETLREEVGALFIELEEALEEIPTAQDE